MGQTQLRQRLVDRIHPGQAGQPRLPLRKVTQPVLHEGYEILGRELITTGSRFRN